MALQIWPIRTLHICRYIRSLPH